MARLNIKFIYFLVFLQFLMKDGIEVHTKRRKKGAMRTWKPKPIGRSGFSLFDN